MAGMKTLSDRMRRIRRLNARLAALEEEVQECRQVNLRVAELVDVVGELLLPVAQRDEERIGEALRRYSESVGGPRT
jgi:hypothetical protein